MSSTSFFAELVKSKKNLRKLQEVMTTKDGDESGRDSGRDDSRLNGSADDSQGASESCAVVLTTVNEAGVITILDSADTTPSAASLNSSHNSSLSAAANSTAVNVGHTGAHPLIQSTFPVPNSTSSNLSMTHITNGSTVVGNTKLNSPCISKTTSVPVVNLCEPPATATAAAASSGNSSQPATDSSNVAQAAAAPVVDVSQPPVEVTSLRRIGSSNLTKLPLPPGISLEDIDSPTSPSSPSDKSKRHRFSITKDLPMPPGEL